MSRVRKFADGKWRGACLCCGWGTKPGSVWKWVYVRTYLHVKYQHTVAYIGEAQ